MALSVDYLYRYSLRLIKKSMSGGLSPTDFEFYWNESQNTYMNSLLGPFQMKSADPQNPKVGLIQNQTNLKKLQPFVVTTSITPSGGLAAKPSNYIYAMNLSTNGYEMIPITLNQYNIVSRSVIDAPSTTNNKYYYAENNSSFKVLPATLSSAITLEYVKMPTDIVWGYTFDGNGRPVYDSATSTQQEWDDISAREITMRMLKLIGVSFKDGDFAQFGQGVMVNGQ